MSIHAGDILDLVKGTLLDLGPNSFQQIAQTLQNYQVMGSWLKKDRVTFDSGRGIQKNLMDRVNRRARHLGLMETDGAVLPDLMSQLNIPWRHAQTDYPIVYQTDILMNRGKALVFNVLKPRRAGCMIDLADELEAKAWTCPTAANDVDPYGVPYYVVYNATTGFTGGLPSDHTTVAGINLTNTRNFKNYSVNMTALTKADGIKKMRKLHRAIDWISPVGVPDYSGPTRDLRIYTNDNNISDFEDLGEAQNENLGRDVAPMTAGSRKGAMGLSTNGAGDILFRKMPIEHVRQMDDTSVFSPGCTDPIYFIDHSTFTPVVLKGDFLRESDVEKVPGQHNVFRVFIDLTYNYLCFDRRRNGIIAKT